MPAVYFPTDEFSNGHSLDFDLAADYLELKALLSKCGQSFSADIVQALELAADEPFRDVNEEMELREEVADGTVARISSRKRVLREVYPFELDRHGATISLVTQNLDFGQSAYLVSLILSNLRAVSPLLQDSERHPTEQEIKKLREYFQYFATLAMAAEVQGPAWSFGFPRPDGSGFIDKLTEIWSKIKDGKVGRDPSAPLAPKDDAVDIFAYRPHQDDLPGFLLAAAQVSTGKNWKEKSIRLHVEHGFPMRWFERSPATRMIAYHVIPFTRPDRCLRDDVIMMGNLLHRLRVSLRVAEVAGRISEWIPIETCDKLQDATNWINSYLHWESLS